MICIANLPKPIGCQKLTHFKTLQCPIGLEWIPYPAQYNQKSDGTNTVPRNMYRVRMQFAVMVHIWWSTTCLYGVLQDHKNILTKFASNYGKGLDGAAICANFGLPNAIGYKVMDPQKFVRHFTVKCHISGILSHVTTTCHPGSKGVVTRHVIVTEW